MIIVYTVCADESEAKKIADALVKERLAACVNQLPIKSTFWWKDKQDNADEVALLVKTRKELVPKVFERVKDLHSYEIPPLFTIPVGEVDDKYLEWLNKETQNI
ncbi:divalent-cation tolerance protein CutA [Nanoarchaeota archaeon]